MNNEPRYDWQQEVIDRIELRGGDPLDMNLWREVCAEVWADEEVTS